MRNDKGFAAIITSMYENVVPPSGYTFVPEDENKRAFYARTGMIPVEVFNDGDATPLFDDQDTYYKMQAWIQYRIFSVASYGDASRTFDVLVQDVLRYNREHGGIDVSHVITMLDAIYNVSKEYDMKFRHMPVSLDKFVASFIKYGRKYVLRSDIY